MKLLIVVTLLCLSQLSISADASDIAREKRLASQVVDSIIDGEPVFLKSGGHEFLSIYTCLLYTSDAADEVSPV